MSRFPAFPFIDSRSLAVAVLALVLAAAPVRRVAAGTLAFDPAGSRFFGADTLTVESVVDPMTVDLRGFSIVIEFDPGVIRPVEALAGSLLTGATCSHFFAWLNEAAEADSIEIDGATLGCSVAGPGSLIRLRFLGVRPGTSPLRCRQASLRNGQNAEILSGCTAAAIEYGGAVEIRSSSWGMMKALYR